MNVYRLIGDFLHLLSIIWLLIKLIKTKSCGGVSGKTQLLFAVVYSTRYLDLFTSYISAYNTSFKITYILCYYVIVMLIFGIFRKTYRKTEDTFMTELLLVPCFLLALWFNYAMTPTEILWAFSIFLEAVAILPQFYMIHNRREVEKGLLYYLIPLGLYRLYYIFNWIYRYTTEDVFDEIVDAAGIVYVGLYIVALIEFFIIKVKITNDENGTFLRKNIFFISSNEPYTNIACGEKNEQLLDGEKA